MWKRKGGELQTSNSEGGGRVSFVFVGVEADNPFTHFEHRKKIRSCIPSV